MAKTPTAGDSAERLLDAADRLMYSHGYQGVGVADLCREAGVRPGSFYYHFESKEALAAAMLERAWRRVDAAYFDAAFEPASLRDPFEAIDRYAELLERNLLRHAEASGVVAGCRFGNFAVETAPHLPLVGAATRRVFAAMAARFRTVVVESQQNGVVDPALDPEVAAHLLLAQMEGLMVLAKANGDPATIRLLGPAARRLLGCDRPAADDAAQPDPIH